MIRRKTEFVRATLIQEARIILFPEENAPPGAIRKVQVLVPPSPSCFMELDVLPEEIGPNKSYKVPPLSPGQRITFHLFPDQWIVAMCSERHASMSLIVEYLASGTGLGGDDA